jgi:hypothetical protein
MTFLQKKNKSVMLDFRRRCVHGLLLGTDHLPLVRPLFDLDRFRLMTEAKKSKTNLELVDER